MFQARGRLGWPTVATVGERSRFVARLHYTAASKAVYGNPPDWAEMMAWRQLLRPGDLFIDGGANVGIYSLWAAEAGADVLAVEPNPDAYGQLVANARLNGYPIDARQVALGPEPGTARMTSAGDTMNRIADDGDTIVSVATLDDLIGGRRVAGVKLDLEGYEQQALEGARRALADRRITAMQLEWNACADRTPCADLLASCGYTFHRPDNTGRLMPTDPGEIGADVFALRG